MILIVYSFFFFTCDSGVTEYGFLLKHQSQKSKWFNFSKLCGTFLLHTNVKSYLKIHLKDLHHPKKSKTATPYSVDIFGITSLKKKKRKEDKKAFLHKANEQEIWVACKVRVYKQQLYVL